jgi:hypothetical protein
VSDFGLRQVGGPFVIGVLGGLLTGWWPTTDMLVMLGGLILTGLVASLPGRGIVGFIAVMLGTPVALLAGWTLSFGVAIWGGDLAGLVLGFLVGLGVLVPAAGYGLGRIVAGAVTGARRESTPGS